MSDHEDRLPRAESYATVGDRILNLRPDPIDPRDRSFASRRMGRGIVEELPDTIDYSGRQVGPVVDQGMTGSCVGQACAALCYWLYGEMVSARWIWMGAKEIDSWVPSVCFEGAGTQIRDAFKILNKYGAPLNIFWPLEEQLPDSEVEHDIQADALTRRIGEYWKLETTLDQRTHLAQVGPFVVGVPVFENWDEIQYDGRVPEPGGAQLGGHALLICGYDVGGFQVKNSWGEDWGKRGYGRISYDYPIWDAWGTSVLTR